MERYTESPLTGPAADLARSFAYNVNYQPDGETGVFWILTPVKNLAAAGDPTASHLWYLVPLRMHGGATGFLDLRVLGIESLFLLGLLVVAPALSSNRGPEVRLTATVAAIFGVTFGISIFAWNIMVWGFDNSDPLQYLPLTATAGLAIIGVALSTYLRGRNRKSEAAAPDDGRALEKK
ncbi:hypothetical protein [Nocardia sp. NRRL WC-3656]|uniref:hypothetical protein n=1 Tax=Nocardia sp. NRRL WC-3656 TaxID=1463824 RepID=UPI0012DD827F|nr:hypothetical protein [Nocardia sp. NRRL WC-3656]